MKITDKRSAVKQIISGICWSPLVVMGLCVAAFVGLMAYEIIITIVTGGLVKVLILIVEVIGIVVLIVGYLITFVWSNQN